MRELPTGTLTLLFTDIEGSTRLLQQAGEHYIDLLYVCRSLLRAVFHQFGGHEVDTQGDVFFVAFIRASDAIAAAVAGQRALFAHTWPQGMMVRVRMGLHTGEPQRTAEGYVGLDVHHTARIMSAGHGGQVLLSQATREQVQHDLPDDVSLRDLGEHHLKDLVFHTHLYQLVIQGLPADFPPLNTLDLHRQNLPLQLTPFIGREREMASVLHLLHRQDVRLLTLTGPGGSGKTRLGLQVAAEIAEEFSQGVFFVNLAPISDSALVIPTIAQTVDLKEVEGRSAFDLLEAFLREKHVLLLLDNFEQVVQAAAQVADLLSVCPQLKLLVTSRMALHVRAEQEFMVPPLRVPDPKHLPDLLTLSQYEAVALFIRQAQAVKADFQITNTTAPAVAEICVRLDGLPLAIELAAARSKLFPPPALLARLGQRLPVLTGGALDAPARQQTLRNTIAWSYQLLDAGEQRLFRRLAVFVGGCTLQAIEALYIVLDKDNGAEGVMEAIDSLIDKSLLQQTEQEGKEPRLVMLETIREYAVEKLQASGEIAVCRQAHAHYFLALAEQAEPELQGLNQAIWMDRLEQEHDNLRAALEWALEDVPNNQAEEHRDMILRISAALWPFWWTRGYSSEARIYLERALARSEGADISLHAKVLQAGAHVALQQGDYARAEELIELCLTLYQEMGNIRGLANCHGLLVNLAMYRGELSKCITLAEERVRLIRQVGEPGEVAQALSSLAEMFDRLGEIARAQPLYKEALQLYREVGNDLAVAATLIESATGFWWNSRGGAATLQTIRHWLQEGQVIVNKLGSRHWIAYSSFLAALVALTDGDTDGADSLTRESLAIWGEIGRRWGVAWALHVLGRVEVQRGDLTAACSWYQQSLALTLELGDKFLTPYNLEGLGAVLAAQGELVVAARFWGAAEVLREATAPLAVVDRANYKQAVAAAKAQLGERAFAAAWAEGRSMSLEQVFTEQSQAAMQAALLIEAQFVSPVKPSPLYPDGLTAREAEVLRLVAQGLTDAQIAERLVISPRTVNTHLKSIYGKIQVSSRSAATRYAIEHQLL